MPRPSQNKKRPVPAAVSAAAKLVATFTHAQSSHTAPPPASPGSTGNPGQFKSVEKIVSKRSAWDSGQREVAAHYDKPWAHRIIQKHYTTDPAMANYLIQSRAGLENIADPKVRKAMIQAFNEKNFPTKQSRAKEFRSWEAQQSPVDKVATRSVPAVPSASGRAPTPSERRIDAQASRTNPASTAAGASVQIGPGEHVSTTPSGQVRKVDPFTASSQDAERAINIALEKNMSPEERQDFLDENLPIATDEPKSTSEKDLRVQARNRRLQERQQEREKADAQHREIGTQTRRGFFVHTPKPLLGGRMRLPGGEILDVSKGPTLWNALKGIYKQIKFFKSKKNQLMGAGPQQGKKIGILITATMKRTAALDTAKKGRQEIAWQRSKSGAMFHKSASGEKIYKPK